MQTFTSKRKNKTISKEELFKTKNLTVKELLDLADKKMLELKVNTLR